MRLKCTNTSVTSIDWGGETFTVKNGHIVVPMGAAESITKQPGAFFTAVMEPAIVKRTAEVLPIAPEDLAARLPEIYRNTQTYPTKNKHKR